MFYLVFASEREIMYKIILLLLISLKISAMESFPEDGLKLSSAAQDEFVVADIPVYPLDANAFSELSKIMKNINFSSCCAWVGQKTSNLFKGSTLSGQEVLEEECLRRKTSTCYEYLQALSLVAMPLAVGIVSGASLEETLAQQAAIFVFYFGFDLSDSLSNLLLKGTPKKFAREVVAMARNSQNSVLMSLFPSAYAQALFLDLLSNEVAAKVSKNMVAGEQGKNVAFFLVKNGVRLAIMLSDHVQPAFPSVSCPEICFSRNPEFDEIEFSINLAWINKEINNNKYVFPPQDRSGVNIRLAILGWLKQNSQTELNFWYDSNFVSSAQIEQTINLFDKINKDIECDKCLKLMDYSSLDIYKNNKDFLTTKAPVFWKADMFRVLASVAMLEEYISPDGSLDRSRYFIYADTDVTPMSKESIFDPSTLQSLEKYSFVLQEPANGDLVPENSFFIMSNHQIRMHGSIKRILSDLLVKGAESKSQISPEEAFYELFYIFIDFEGKLGPNTPTKKVDIAPRNSKYY